ncbi:hypothetical protein FACS1894181_12500 [Bacteroidia bacterium]|nr:hypothetical protein FACS1894181_12500 [Bacteroidia bacterium]
MKTGQNQGNRIKIAYFSKNHYLYPMGRVIPHYFSGVEDPRVQGRCRHLLPDILLTGLCTYVTGGVDCQDMHLFAKERGHQLQGILQLPDGEPSADSFEKVFKLIMPDSLQSILETCGKGILSCLAEKQIILDGKKLKGVSPASRDTIGLYILNAWVSGNRLCTGQEKAEEKSNGITAIPKALDSIDLTDAVVSIGAIGTQTKIAEQTITQGGHYLLPAKGNQQGLLEDMGHAFKADKVTVSREETESNHGRIEPRQCSTLPAKGFLLGEKPQAWKQAATLIKIEATRGIKGILHQEPRYYINVSST